jgi:acetyl-CoA/propionyl-CoA carboxylase biotin carboxyl carrier protein
MRVVRAPGELVTAVKTAQREAEAAFGVGDVYIEKYVDSPRHIEFQILGDTHGNVVHLGERECSIQRRHQKLIEESPSPVLTDKMRRRMGGIVIDAARAVQYTNAGTFEFLMDPQGHFYFMEANTRLQVEHPVTEMVTGIDIVKEQIRIAAGAKLGFRQGDVVFTGHSIECRINAEDVSAGFRPSPGRISSYREPAGPGVRVDSGVAAGSEVSELYDPMVAKLIVHDVDRDAARRRMLRALEELEIGGVKTLVGFHRALLAHPCFVAGETCDGVVESEELAQAAEALSPPVVAAQVDGHVTRSALAVELDGRRIEVAVLRPEPGYRELARRREEREATHRHGGAADAIVSPMQGTVIEVRVAEGDEVEPGAVICIVEAMKMENELTAHRAGVVTGLAVAAGDAVAFGQTICVVEPGETG